MECMLRSLSRVIDVPYEVLAQRTQGVERTVVDNLAIGEHRFRGLHPQELADIALENGFALIEIEMNPAIEKVLTGQNEPKALQVYADPVSRFNFYTANYDGIMLGHVGGSPAAHAVAWKGGQIIDDTNRLKPGDQFSVHGIMIVLRIITLDMLRASAEAQGIPLEPTDA